MELSGEGFLARECDKVMMKRYVVRVDVILPEPLQRVTGQPLMRL